MKTSDKLNSPGSLEAGVQDCLFLSLIVLMSFILYIWDLGFYLDDYAYIKRFMNSNDQSILGLSHALYSEEPNTRTRPVEVLFLAGQYWLFGPYPLPYHLVNSTILLSSILLFYLVLREMEQPRLVALTVPLVYALLPHYSTDRFWVVTFPHIWSMALYFLSLYADLRALQNQLAQMWRWKLLSYLGLLGSGLAYEVALPLFLLHPLIIWHHAQQLYGRVPGKKMVRQNGAVLLASNLFLLGLVLAFKVLMTVNLGTQTGLQLGVKRGGYLDYVALLVTEALRVNYGTYGLGLPYVTWRALHLSLNWTLILLAGFVALIIFGYLLYIAKQALYTMPSKAVWRNCITAGLVVFGLGYAVFLSTDRIGFSSAGLDNRVAIAAAIGVALSFVGGIGWLSALIRSNRSAKRVFCLLVALLCACGFFIINTVAAFWVTAYRQQQAILMDIRGRIPTLSAGSTLILDGVCPVIGPAVVFKSHYDLAGALILTYRELRLRADVAARGLRIEEKGISVKGRFYPYDEKLLLYNFAQKTIYQLTNAETAHRYSQMLNPDRGCLTGSWGWRSENSAIL